MLLEPTRSFADAERKVLPPNREQNRLGLRVYSYLLACKRLAAILRLGTCPRGPAAHGAVIGGLLSCLWGFHSSIIHPDNQGISGRNGRGISDFTIPHG